MIRPGIRKFFRLALRRRDIVMRNVDEEIRMHLELRIEQLVHEGFSPETAREEAIRRFGSMEDARRELQQHAHQRERTMQFREWLDALRQDVRYAARGLRREPLFAGFVIATLALGIGANAAMFGVVDRLLLRGPEHIVDASRVMRVYLHEKVAGQGDVSGSTFGYVMYDLLKHDAHAFDGVAAYVASSHRQTVMGHGSDAELIMQGQASADLFPTLGVKPALGRFFTAEEDNTGGAERVAVIGYGLWRRVYGGDPAVLGKTILLADVPFTIVGVAPNGYTGPQLGRVDVWVPVSLHVSMRTDDWTHTWHAQWLEVVVRLKPGVTPAQASIDATAAYRHAYNGGDKEDAAANIFVAPLSYNDDGKESTEASVSRWLVGVAIIVLLIACSNVVNLLLARAVRRRREVAVRLALGAARRRLIQLLLTESMMLAALGGTAGLAVAWITGQLMRTVLLADVEWTSSPVDGRVLAVSALIALSVGIVVGLVPALRSSRPDLTTALKSGIREGGAQAARGAHGGAGRALDRVACRRWIVRPKPVEYSGTRSRHSARPHADRLATLARRRRDSRHRCMVRRVGAARAPARASVGTDPEDAASRACDAEHRTPVPVVVLGNHSCVGVRQHSKIAGRLSANQRGGERLFRDRRYSRAARTCVLSRRSP